MPNGRPSADSPPQRPVAWAIEMAVERVRKESERSGLRRAAPCPRLYTRRPAEEIAMAQPPRNPRPDVWPTLPYKAWQDTCVTLHLWTQIVGNIRLALTPWVNHYWHATLYVPARGLTTPPRSEERRDGNESVSQRRS